MAATAVALAALLGVAVSTAAATAAPDVVAATGPTPLAVPVGATKTIPGASVTGFQPGEQVRLTASVTSGGLSLPDSLGGVTVPVGYPPLGTSGSHVAFEGTQDAVNAALASLAWTPATAGAADVTVDASPAGAAYDADNGHYYQVVTQPAPASWDQARASAEATTFNGYTGYLATITSEAEQKFVSALTAQPAWIGATDNAASSWQWATGPEAGTVFWTPACGTGLQGTCASGFSMWQTGEPSAMTGHDAAVMQGADVGGVWRAVSAQSLPLSIVEYGGVGATAPLVHAHASTTMQAIVPPAAPVVDGATAGTQTATVTWHDTVGGGSTATAYVVTGAPSGSCLVEAPATTCVVNGLTAGVGYQFRVAGLNDAGMGPWSGPSPAVVPRYPTTTQLQTNGTGGNSGSPVTLVATVLAPEGSPRPPSGHVRFFDGATVLASIGTLNATATLTTTLAAGPHQLTATYEGDGTFGSSTSAPLSVEVPSPPLTPAPDATTAPPPTIAAPDATTAPPDTQPPDVASTDGSSTSPTTSGAAPIAGTVAPRVATSTVATTAASSPAATGAATTAPPSTVAPSAPANSNGVSVVFDVGVGTAVEHAELTVRASGLRAGSTLTVTAHSTPVTLAQLTVGRAGSVQWAGTLPTTIDDGDHTIEVLGTGADGNAVGRVSSFAVSKGVLTRIGAAVAPPAPPVPTTASRSPVTGTAPPEPSPSSSGGGGLWPQGVLLVLAFGGAGTAAIGLVGRRGSSTVPLGTGALGVGSADSRDMPSPPRRSRPHRRLAAIGGRRPGH